MHHLVGVVVIIAILGRSIEQHLARTLVALEVGLQHSQQLGHGQRPMVKDMVFDGGQSIGHGAQTNSLDVGGVVPGTATVVVLTGSDTVVDKQREERSGHVGGVELFYDVVATDLDVQEVVQLGVVGLKELCKVLEAGRISGFWPKLLSGTGVTAIVQSDFQYLGHVKVAGQIVVLFAKSTNLDTPAGAAVARIGNRLAHANQLLDDQVAVEYGGLAKAGADDACCPPDESIWVLFADLNRGAGLKQSHFLNDV